MTENQWKTAFKRYVDERGCFSLRLHGHDMQAPGWPDLWITGPGLWRNGYWVEVKTSTGKLSDAQRLVLKRIGVLGFVLRRTKTGGFRADEPLIIENHAGEKLREITPEETIRGKPRD